MELGRKLARNTGFVFISEIMNKFFSVCFFAYAARVLGPENFGFYALLGTITFIFFFFATAGIGTMAVREISRDKSKAKELFNYILSLKVTLVLCAYPILILIVNILGYSEDFKFLVYISGFSTVFSVFSHSFGVLYVAYEQFKIPAIASIAVAFLSNFCNIAVLYLGYGLKGIVIISFFGALIGAVISGIWIRKRIIKFKFAFDWSVWKELILQSMPFAIISFFQQANRHVNVLLLSKIPSTIPGPLAIGYYNPASSVCQGALVLPLSFGQAVLPTIASNSSNTKMVENIINKSTKALIAVVIFPLTLATTFFPKEIITLIFGNDYVRSAPALTILGWAYALQVFNAPVSVTLSASRQIKRFIPWVLFLFGLNIILAVPLIFYYSFVGAATAFLISKIVETFLRNYLLKNIFGIKRLKMKEFLKVLTPVMMTFAVLFFARLGTHDFKILLILCFMLYSGCLFLFRDFRQGINSLLSGSKKGEQ